MPDFSSECQVLSGSPVRSVRGRGAAVRAKVFSAPVKQTGVGSAPSASVSKSFGFFSLSLSLSFLFSFLFLSGLDMLQDARAPR